MSAPAFPCPGLRRAVLLLPLLVALLAPGRLPAAPSDAWLYQAWQTDDGLPSNDVTAVTQAADSAMLISTRSGLARFDGWRLRDFDLPLPGVGGSVEGVLAAADGALWYLARGSLVVERPGQRPVLIPQPKHSTASRLTALFEQPGGVVWLSHDDGILARVENGRIELAPTAPDLGAGFARAAALDAAGQVWAAGPGQLARWAGGRFEKVAPLPAEPAGQPAVCGARAGGLWIAQGRRLLRSSAGGEITAVADLPPGPAGTRAATIFEDRAGRVWVGMAGDGLWLWTGTQFEKVALPNHDVWWLSEDREGNLWVGTGGGGVCRVRPRVLTLLAENGGPVAQTARAISTDARGDLWVVLQTGQLFVRRAGLWQHLVGGRDWPATLATCVAADATGQVWLATSESQLVRWDGTAFALLQLPQKLSPNRIRALFAPPGGGLWVGRGNSLLRGQGGQWTVFTPPANTGGIQALAQDLAGRLWAGTNSGHLLLVEGARLLDRTPAELAGQGAVRTLLATADGALWIGTDGGLARLHEGRCRILTTAHGLPHNTVSQLTLDPQGRLWGAGHRGLFQASLHDLTAVATGRAATFRCAIFGRGENVPGLQANSGYSPGTLTAPDGRLWFSTRSGLVIADPAVAGSNSVPPPVSIERLRVDGAPVPLSAARPLRLGPRLTALQFTLAAMSFTAPENVVLQHRLDDLETAWTETPRDRTVSYSHLPPGSYTLRVRAANNDGVWSEKDATLSFTILPFFWQRLWFQAGVLLALLALTARGAQLVARRQLRHRAEAVERAAALDRERARIARDMHDQLGASLTQIGLLAELADSGHQPPPHLRQLAQTAREAVTALDEIVWAVNPRHDTLASLVEYLGQQSLDLLRAAGLRGRLDFPAEVPPRPLPTDFRYHLYLMVREAVHNAARHAAAREVQLRVEITPADLCVTVADDGRGFTENGAAPATGNGLANIRTRAAALGGDCQIERQQPAGTVIRIRLPWPGWGK